VNKKALLGIAGLEFQLFFLALASATADVEKTSPEKITAIIFIF